MRYLFFVSVFLLHFSGYGQKDMSVSDLNPYQDEVKQTILAFFESFHKGDTLNLKNTIGENLILQTIVVNKEGKTVVMQTPKQNLFKAISSKPKDQQWNEKLMSFTINADAKIATAWTPYEFFVNDTFSHCGVNVFQLYKDENQWRIIAIADTRQKEGCQ